MNKNPFWKYIVLVIVLVPALLFALPNVYDNDPGIQIKGLRGAEVDANMLSRVESALGSADIKPKSLSMDRDILKIRFGNTQEQLSAQKKVNTILGNNYSAALSSISSSPDWLTDLGALPMYLGLDLRGGVHFLIQVDSDFAVERSKKGTIGTIRRVLRENNIASVGAPKTINQTQFEITLKNSSDLGQARRRIALDFPNLLLLDFERDGQTVIQASISDFTITEIKRNAIRKNIQALRSRVDELGVAEPVIQQQGLDRIVVQLPGVQDPVKAREILGSTATLEVYLVDERNDSLANSARTPSGSARYYFRDGRPILLKRRLIYSGSCVIDAGAGFDQQNGGAIVNLTLDSKCGSINYKVTSDNVNNRMAVVFAETKTDIVTDSQGNQTPKVTVIKEVLTAPVINEPLRERFQISGMANQQEAQSLALNLRAGALDTPIYIIEERTVGPSLGKENIEKGFKSVMYGFLAVLVFMIIYYRFFGGVASVALVLNLVIIVSVLSMFQATLTLPGVAGMVLTVGMAVDANVLIFERIREEIRAGAKPQQAIFSGYDKAYSTIVDANITTLIAALVLYVFGNGPVQGFALTLGIGIITSMFTAIFVSRILVNAIYGARKLEKLAI
ncbi:MAG: protein translocase subunit SecD [Arenicella sp.]